jgi:hypothetical protein
MAQSPATMTTAEKDRMNRRKTDTPIGPGDLFLLEVFDQVDKSEIFSVAYQIFKLHLTHGGEYRKNQNTRRGTL